GRLYPSIFRPIRWKDIIPDIIFKGLPEHNGISAVSLEIFFQRKIFLVVTISPAANGEDPVSGVDLIEISFKKLFRHSARRARFRLNLGIAEQDDYDIAIRIADRLSSISKLIEVPIRISAHKLFQPARSSESQAGLCNERRATSIAAIVSALVASTSKQLRSTLLIDIASEFAWPVGRAWVENPKSAKGDDRY